MSKTGRHYVTKNGRTFCIEPIDNSLGKGRKKWGDINPATGKVEGDYGDKFPGAVHEDDSIITKENGFKNIRTIGPGDPYSEIDKIISESK